MLTRAIALAAGSLFAAVLATPASGAGTVRFFQSPSGNIGCVVSEDAARCDITKRGWKAPKRPKTCDLDWGSFLTVGKNNVRGRFACVGDTARNPNARRLKFGRSISVGKLRCTSRTDGVRCVNGRGRGFFVSRGSYKLF